MKVPHESRESFIADVRDQSPNQLLDWWLDVDFVPHATPTAAIRDSFYQKISKDWPMAEQICIAGTGGWRFSLNPDKNFKEYSKNSDLDIILVSSGHFVEIWDHLRKYEVKKFRYLPKETQETFKRKTENIYSGFISPEWIPDSRDKVRFTFTNRLATYTGTDLGYRHVNMFLFRNLTEAKNYYSRGLRTAKYKLKWNTK